MNSLNFQLSDCRLWIVAQSEVEYLPLSLSFFHSYAHASISLSPSAMLHLACVLNIRHFRCTVYLIQTISAANFTQLLLLRLLLPPVLALAIYGIDFELILRKFIDEFHFITFHFIAHLLKLLYFQLLRVAFLSLSRFSLSFFRSFKSSSSTNWNTIPNFAVLFVFHSTRKRGDCPCPASQTFILANADGI